jgi:hypothetical protein
MCGMVVHCTSTFEEGPNSELKEVPVPEGVLRDRIDDLYNNFGDSVSLIEKAIETAKSAPKLT